MSRDYAGIDARWTDRFRQAPIPVTVTAGLAVDGVREDRQGYNSFTGTAANPTALGVGYRKVIGPWTVPAFARVDNLFDRRYVRSVIVNDGNNRFYEGAPGRNWSTGIQAAYAF